MTTTMSGTNRPKRGEHKKKEPLSETEKTLRCAATDAAVRLMVKERISRGGRLPQDCMPKLLNDLRKTSCLQDITRSDIYNCEAKLKAQKTGNPLASPPANVPQNRATPSPPLAPRQLDDDVGTGATNRGGRPKGSTKEAKLDAKEAKESALKWASEQLKARQAMTTNSKLPSGTLRAIVIDAKEKFNIPDDVKLSHETIKSRVKRKNVDGRQKSPMQDVEPCLVELCKQCSRMGNPVDCANFLDLANSFIANSPVEREALRLLTVRRQFAVPGRALGDRCYRQFLKRWQRELDSVRRYIKDNKRQEWGTCHAIKLMCDCICCELCRRGIARKLDTPVWRNHEGDVVEEGDACGLLCECELVHPERLLHLDETGCDANMKKDGQQGGKRHIGEKGMRCTLPGITTDLKFTLLPICDSLGNPALCVVIFASEKEKIPVTWTAGVDLMVDMPGNAAEANDNTFTAENTGAGKLHPRGPVCVVNNIEVPCCCACSPFGGIASIILADVFRHLDHLGVCPRGNGIPDPSLVLDGHGSRFDLPFLQHINQHDHKWEANVGNPCCTDLWQTGDAEQCNGCFKIEFGAAKQRLLQRRLALKLPMRFDMTDVIPLVNAAWTRSFGNAANTKKALADRGWNPMNRALLLHPDVVKTKDLGPDNPLVKDNELQLNVDEGKAGQVIDELFARQDRTKKRNRQLAKAKEAKNANAVLNKTKKLGSGGLVVAGSFNLSGPEALEQAIGHNAMKTEEEEGKKKRKCDTCVKLKAEADAARQKNPEDMNEKDFKALLKHKKDHKKDGKMAHDLAGLREQWKERQDRPSPVKPAKPTSPTTDPEGLQQMKNAADSMPDVDPDLDVRNRAEL